MPRTFAPDSLAALSAALPTAPTPTTMRSLLLKVS
jgi:hypothetical protein